MKNMGINGKFSIIISVFLITIFMIFGAGVYGMMEINSSSEVIIKEHAKRRILANRVMALAGDVAIGMRDLMLSDDAAVNAKINERIDESLKKAEEGFAEMRALEDEASKESAEASWSTYEKWKEANIPVRALALQNKNEEAYKLSMSTAAPIRGELTKHLKQGIEIASNQMQKAEEENRATFIRLRTLMIAVAALGLMAGIGLAVVTLRNINKAVSETIATLFDTANQVASAAQQVAASSQSLSEAATQQGASLEETSAAVEEMNSMVGRNAESARESSEVADKGVKSAHKGQDVVDRMMSSMQEINVANQSVMRQTDLSNAQLTEIVSLIHEIGNKTKVINEIVFQTKLLSFNASVEAARAGEHGKGFAVVAEEVGNLARMSGSAAKDITELLEGSITKVQAIVANSKSQIEKIINDNTQKVDLGTRIARECRVVLEDISKGILDVSQMTQSISGASDEQARGISEINKAITQLDQVTQVNAASAEEAASASEELSAQAEHMKLAVSRLVQVIRGSNGELVASASVSIPRPNRSNVVPLRKPIRLQSSGGAVLKRVVGGSDLGSED